MAAAVNLSGVALGDLSEGGLGLAASRTTVSIAGSAGIAWWRADVGVVHLVDRTALGFATGARLGFRLGRSSRWSISVGSTFDNVTVYYADEAARPAHHVLGELGVSVVLARSEHATLKLGLDFVAGGRRSRVARFDAARRIDEELVTAELGGGLDLSVWLD